MNALNFLAEWAVRSSLLIGIAATALWALRVKDPSVRLAAWTAVLAGSFLIPVMSASLPMLPMPPVHVTQAAPAVVPILTVPIADAVGHATLVASTRQTPSSAPFDWAMAGLILYAAIALAMLLRLGIGLLGSLRLLRRSNATERDNIRESERIAAPVTLGFVRPSIVLPQDWREWDPAKLDAVLAHERSHIERRDPIVQLASAIHRSLLWFSPFAWFLHSCIVRTAEEASDDAGVCAIQDRASYAELLLDFVQRGVRVRSIQGVGVPMARYGRADRRIHRILDSTVLSRGLTKRALATIVLIGLPLAYVVATAKAQSPSPPAAPTKQSSPAKSQPGIAAPKPVQAKPASTSGELAGLGTVVADTVTVRAQTEGRLAVNFREGQPVELRQLLGSVGAETSGESSAVAGLKVDLGEAKVRELQAKVNASGSHEDADALREARLNQARNLEELEEVRRQGEAALIRAPMAGVVGLRLIDAGNMVHRGDPIVVIAQLQPINVVFTIPQDLLPQVRKRINAGDNPLVEAWTRDEKTKVATGTLTAIDNHIDEQTGTIKLKATFDNKDSALFPNQFVNVRVKIP